MSARDPDPWKESERLRAENEQLRAMTDKSTVRCATCLWFERGSAGDRSHGLCMYAPPVIQVVVPPPTPVGQPRPSVQGLRPPSHENDRCHHWEKQFHPVRTLLSLAAPEEKAP